MPPASNSLEVESSTLNVERSEALLRLTGIETDIGGSRILRGVNLEVNSGEVVALMGRNGVGKTTTLKSITGVLPVRTGSILFDGQRIEQLPVDVRARAVLMPVENQLYRLAAGTGVLNRAMYAYDGNPTPKEYTETRDLKKLVAVKSEVGYLKLGELEVAAIPGEIYPELVLGKVQDPADPGQVIASLPPQGRDAIKQVLNSLDRVAFLTQGDWIPEETVMPWMNPMVVKSWARLAVYVEYERQRRREPDYYQAAGQLAGRCQAWRARHVPEAQLTWLEDAL